MGKRNTEIFNLEILGRNVRFECDAGATRDGFVHHAKLFIDGKLAGKHNAYYLNRAWESWRYQSACLGLCSKQIENRAAYLKDEYKRRNGIIRVAGPQKKELENLIDDDAGIILLREIKNALSKDRP